MPDTLKKDIVISSTSFSSNDIGKKIRNLSPNNVHGHDMMTSIHMIKICGESISKPLEIIFKSCIGKG